MSRWYGRSGRVVAERESHYRYAVQFPDEPCPIWFSGGELVEIDPPERRGFWRRLLRFGRENL